MRVPASDLGLYEWTGRTIEYHRAQIRRYLGFRECTVADAEKIAAWLAEDVCCRDRRPEHVREELIRYCRGEGIELPAPARIGRIIGSGLHQAEQTLTARIAGRIPAEVAARLDTLIAAAADGTPAIGGPSAGC